MSSITLEILTKKLQTAPPSVLERILGYAEALLDNQEKEGFTLSEDQKKILLKQNDVPLDKCAEAQVVYENLKSKYGL